MMLPVTVACDVDSPLFGELGAARVFAPQKGADERQVEVLDRGLRRLADAIRRDLGVDVSEIAGGGAAGGLRARLAAFVGRRLQPRAARPMAEDAAKAPLDGGGLPVTGGGSLCGSRP